jgi:disulfide bond formation protein DsbB
LPAVLSCALAVIGAFIAIRAVRQGESRVEQGYWRPMVFVLGSILVFAFLIPRGGLALSTLFVTILSSFGARETRWRSAVVLGISMALLTALVFVKLLGLPISVWPR